MGVSFLACYSLSASDISFLTPLSVVCLGPQRSRLLCWDACDVRVSWLVSAVALSRGLHE